MTDIGFNEYLLLWGGYSISILLAIAVGYWYGWWACRKKALLKLKEQRIKQLEKGK